MMPIVLAQQIDGINQTLEILENIGNIESIPGALLIMGVLLFLGIVVIAFIFWRVMSAQIKAFERYTTAQQQSADTAQSNYIVERDVTGAKIETVINQTQNISQVIEGYHATLQGLTEKMAQTAQYLAETAKALKTLEQRVVASEADAIDRWAKVEAVGKELKANMSEVDNGNKKILEELRSIRVELKRVADSVEVAMTNLIATVDKLNRPVEPPSTESDTKSESDAST